MEQDNHLKQILLNSAEKASPDFTELVMKKVLAQPVVSTKYQPMVSAGLKKAFLFIYLSLASFILVLCLFIGFVDSGFVKWIQYQELPQLNYRRILFFILAFWIVFAANTLLQKKSFMHRTSLL